MNTYLPVKKIFNMVSTWCRMQKRERHLTLQECFDSSKEARRRRCRLKAVLILFMLSSTVVYVYSWKGNFLKSEPEYAHSMETKMIDDVEDDDGLYQKGIEEAIKIIEEHSIYALGPVDSKTESQEKAFCLLKKPYAKVPFNKTSINITQENVYPMVSKGGYYKPLDCRPRHRVGILVPYRDREHNLGIFLYNIHPFLMQQKLEYQIFVIEQQGNEPFNKGRLYNAGFREMMKFNTFQCVIFHDLDLLPMDENILYTCPVVPRHMCAAVNDTEARKELNVTYKYTSLFGGVTAMTIDQFERANGFSNLYFGWGGEDNDMFWRLRAVGYPIVRYNKSVGVYLVLAHMREPANPFRHHLLGSALDRYKKDGLSNSEYYVMSTKFRHLCTHIVVDINPREDNITELNYKWGVTNNKLRKHSLINQL